MSHFLLNRYANASNPTKVQRTMRECNVVTRSSNTKDIQAREVTIMDNKRARWRGEILDQIPPERVYMAVSDTPPGTPEVGVSNSYIVTQSSKIVWNRVTQQWERATFHSQQASVNTVSKQVRAGWGNGKSRQGGGQ
jgi:hypothetical protein